MKDIKEILIFTIKEIVHKKIFIVTNIFIFAIILLLVNAPNLLNVFNVDLAEIYTENVLIIDKDNVLETDMETLNNDENFINYTVKNENYDEDLIRKDIEEGKVNYALEIIKENEVLSINHIADSTIPSSSIDYNLNLIESIYTDVQIKKLNLSEEEMNNINPVINFVTINLNENTENAGDGAVSIGMIISFVLFFTVYLFAFQVSSAVTTEKTSKIVETLLTSTSSKNIILGKTIGVGILGLSQILIIILFTLVCANIFLPEEILSSLLNVSDLSFTIVFISLVYFVLGYLLFSFLFALAGATVNRLEDVQLANTPVSLISVLGFYLGYFSSLTPDSIINKISSFVPISSPFSMPSRYLIGLASEVELLISILILIITIIIIAYISIRIYSNAILNNGSKMNLKSLINMFKDKSGL